MTAKRTNGTARGTRIGNRKVLGVVALLAAGVLGSGCTVDDLADTSAFTPPQQEPAAAHQPHANPAGTGEKVSTKIDNAVGGEITLSDGTTIEVPAGALPPEIDTITVTSSTQPAPPEYKTVSPVFVFEPDGAVFLKPLKVTIPFSASAKADTSKLTMLWSRRSGAGFDMLPTAFSPANQGYHATGEVMHFSMGVVGDKYTVDPRPAPDPYAD